MSDRAKRAVEKAHQALSLQIRGELLDVATERVKELEAGCAAYRKALEEISQGKGRYAADRLTHAGNTIEDMQALALKALADTSAGSALLEALTDADAKLEYLAPFVPTEDGVFAFPNGDTLEGCKIGIRKDDNPDA